MEKSDKNILTRSTISVGVGVCHITDFSGEFVHAYLELLQHPAITNCIRVQGTLLPQARNHVVKELLDQNKNLTHILLIDSDMVKFFPTHLEKLLSRNVDIISGVCTQTKEPYYICVHGLDQGEIATQLAERDYKKRKIIKVDSVGCAFLLITRRVLDAVKEETTDEDVWFTTDRLQRPGVLKDATQMIEGFLKEDFPNPDAIKEALLELVQFGIDAHRGTPLIGEDVAFCWRARALGFSIYIDPCVFISHLGRKICSIRDTIKHSKVPKEKKIKKPSIPIPAL